MDWLEHPIIVVTYGALFTAAVTSVVALFRRMGGVEESSRRSADHIARLDRAVEEIRADLKQQGTNLSEAMTDLRVHMAEEGKNVERLERLITSALERREVA